MSSNQNSFSSLPLENRARNNEESNIAINVQNLSKCYQIYDKPRDRLMQSLVPRGQRLLGMQLTQYFREFWALKDVSFEIKKGETVGIIGRNGSGKSTLLQLICGTLNPTSGSIQTHGRIAALLELGSGFNPEFTGRENIYFNATVLGLSAEEIDSRFDAIVAFADIGDFIEQPIKTYSSGMYVRLAFSVAINVDPDILIVDEALAVGDEPFQRKCYAKIERIRDSGATVLLVTHAVTTITQMCSRALLLDHGSRLFMGSPKLAVESYYRLIYSSSEETENIKHELKSKDLNEDLASTKINQSVSEYSNDTSCGETLPDVLLASGRDSPERYDPGLKPLSTIDYESTGAQILNVRIENKHGKKINVLAPHEVYWYCYEVSFQRASENVHFGMLIKTTTGHDLGAVGSHPFGNNIASVPAGALYAIRFPFQNVFSPGTYFMNAGCSGYIKGNETFLHRIIDAIAFRVEQAKAGLRYAGSVQVSAGTPTVQPIRE